MGKKTTRQNRKFDFDKPGERKFDFDKPGERHFDFNKDSDGSQHIINQDDNQSNTSGNIPKSNKSKYIAAAVIGLLALGGGGYYLSQQGGETETKKEVANNPEKGNVDETPAIVDTPDEQSQNNTTAPSDKTTKGEGVQSDGNETTDTPSETPNEDSSTQPASGSVTSPEKVEPNESQGPTSNTPPASQTGEPLKTGAPSQPNQTATSSNVTKDVITSSTPIGSIDEEVKNVIRGKYGNNPIRRKMLGSRYAEIQRKVNEIYKKKSRKRRHH